MCNVRCMLFARSTTGSCGGESIATTTSAAIVCSSLRSARSRFGAGADESERYTVPATNSRSAVSKSGGMAGEAAEPVVVGDVDAVVFVEDERAGLADEVSLGGPELVVEDGLEHRVQGVAGHAQAFRDVGQRERRRPPRRSRARRR